MTDSAVLALHRSIDELKSAVEMLCHTYGKTTAVVRLVGDLERLRLDVADVEALRAPEKPVGAAVTAPAVFHMSDEPYDPTMWGNDYDQEGLGGYHGTSR